MTRVVVAGVDGGGSGTRAGIFDRQGRPLGQAEGPPSAIDPRDPEASVRTVAAVVRAAAVAAGIELPVAALHVGLAGAGRPGPRDRVRGRLEGEGLAERLTVGTDVEIAFHDVFSTGPGILLLAGTGSMVWGRGPGEGAVPRRVGGWGPILGDEGSGYAIGRSALRALARAEDGRGPATALTAGVLADAGVGEVAELVRWATTAPRSRIAALAEVVAAADGAGDPTAQAILDRAASELAAQVEHLIDRTGPWNEPIPLAFAGGLVGPGRPLRGRVESALAVRTPAFEDRVPDPVRGAAGLALDALLQV